MDTQLEERLRHDLFDVTRDVEAPVGFAHDALRSGRRLRRRRTSTLVAVGAAAVVAGVLLVPGGRSGGGGPLADDPGSKDPSALMQWARSLPEGPAPALPLFTDAGLRDGNVVVEVPAEVDTSRPAHRVSGGWLVMLRTDAPEVAPAVLSTDGGLRPLPAYPDTENGGWSPAFVSVDGMRVAYGNRVVDVETLDTSAIPHDPAQVEEPSAKWSTSLRISGWTDEGLVYEGAPTDQGLGTEWLLLPNGSTVELAGPESDLHSYGNGTAALAVTYDYTDEANTCVTAHKVRDGAWVPVGTGCMGRYLGESLDASPDGRWLLTDDLPEVWDLHKGEWVSFDAPADVLTDSEADWMGAAGWESDDTLLIPVDDVETAGTHTIQVVRCTVSTRACEKAGAEVPLTLAPDPDPMLGPGPVLSFGDY